MTAPPAPAPPPRLRIGEFRSVAISGLFLLAVLYTLHVARDLILPIVLALFLATLLQPVVRLLRRLRVPARLAPAMVLLVLLSGMIVSGYELWGPTADWVTRAPQDLKKLETKIRRLWRSVESVTRTAAQVDQITDVSPTDTPEVSLKQPSFSELLFGGAWHLLANVAIVLVLAYFFLECGDQLLRKLPRVLRRGHAEQVLAILQEAEAQISRYLLAVTIINAALGLTVAGVMALLGMPTPLLLGAAAALLNFIPYIGPAIVATLLAMIGLVTLNTTGEALLPPLAFLCLHAVESNFVTPHLLGRRLPLNPLVIFLGFLFWLWMWGVPGAILAVPIMVTIKITCDHTERLAGLGEFLGR